MKKASVSLLLLILLILTGCSRADGKAAGTCTILIECSVIYDNPELLKEEKLELLPADGIILEETEVTFYDGETVFDVLQRVCRENKIHLEATLTPVYQSAYIEGIYNLYEFDCGPSSGWTYCVNDQFPGLACSSYPLQPGDSIQWRYTCDLGSDINGGETIPAP